MQNSFEAAQRAMTALFAKDSQFALATAMENIPSVRYVDTFYDEGCFYIVTSAASRKVHEISENPHVSLCSRKMHAFSGIAENIGHPLRPENRKIREKLIHAFEPWYFKHNDEKDENLCFVRVKLESGFLQKNGTGYKVNFAQKTAVEFPFSFDTVLTDD